MDPFTPLYMAALALAPRPLGFCAMMVGTWSRGNTSLEQKLCLYVQLSLLSGDKAQERRTVGSSSQAFESGLVAIRNSGGISVSPHGCL